MSRQFRWSGAIVLLACVLAVSSATAGDRALQTETIASQPTRETILREWQQANSTIDRFDTCFTYILYDDVFRVAREGQGLLSVDRDGRGFYKLESRVHQAGKTPTAAHRTYDGREFKAQPASPECLYGLERV